MIIVTTDFVAGHAITETLGIARGSTIRAKHVGKDIMAGLRTIVGGELKEYSEMLVESRAQAMQRMQEQAEKMGADAVVGVRYVTSQVMSGAAELLAYGTAVKLRERVKRPLAFAAGCLLGALAVAQPVYRWVDAEGNVQFSDRPPPDSATPSEEVQINPGIGPQRELEARLRLTEQERLLEGNRLARSQQATAKSESRADQQTMNDARQQLCARARSNLKTLIDQGPVYSMNSAGQRVFVEDDQRDAEIARYRQAVAQACQ